VTPGHSDRRCSRELHLLTQDSEKLHGLPTAINALNTLGQNGAQTVD
jgi:hypothetical protein